MPDKNAQMSKLLSFTLKLSVTVLLFWLILRGIDLTTLAEQLKNPDPFWIAVAALSLMAQNILVSWRWKLMLPHYQSDIPMGAAIRLTFEGAFFSQALPSMVGGDAVRIFRARHYGMDLGTAASSILLDRLVGLVALLLLACAGLPWILRLDPEGGLSLGLILLLLSGFSITALFLFLPFLPAAIRQLKPLTMLSNQGQRARTFLLSPRTALPLLLVSLMCHFLTLGCFLGLAMALGHPIGWLEIFVAAPASLLITMVPLSIGGWGLREGTMVAALALFQVPGEAALALSISFGLMAILINIPGGIIWLAARREETVSD